MSWQQPYGQNPSYPGGQPYNPSAPPAAYQQHPPGYAPQQAGYPGGAPPGAYASAPGAPQGYGQPPAGAYGGGGYPPYGQQPPAAGQVPQGPPPGVAPDVWNWFQTVDSDRTGRINAVELRSALMNGNNTTFSEGTCRLMIRMFDRDNSGQIDIHEFASLWKYIQDWRQCFERFDNDRSGSISGAELAQALASFGYRLSPQFNENLVRTYAARKVSGSSGNAAPLNAIVFDDFIEACVTIKTLTDAFRANDRQQQGFITIGFEQFLDMVTKVIV